MQRKERRTGVATITALLYATASASAAPPQTRERIPPPAQAAITAEVGNSDPSYWVTESPAGLHATNPSQALRASFRSGGVELAAGAQHWRLSFRAYGYGQDLRPVVPATPAHNANRVEYTRGSLSEWYVNGPAGLEQGFTIAKRPAGFTHGKPLTLALDVAGSLIPALQDDGSGGSLTLRDRDGRSFLRYAGLAAWDARGHELRAWMELSGNDLRLRVDDRSAVYPIVVDPYIQQAKLTASDAQMNTWLGLSIAMSADGNTIVAGAPGDNGRAGAAYVFVKSGPYWTDGVQVAKLTPFDAVALNQFGIAVGISGNGSTIVVGSHAPYVGSSGWAYVFEKPAGGWATTSAATVKLTPSDETGNYFGGSIALSQDGSTLAIGASNSGANRGAAYIYVRPAGGWSTASSFNAKITASDGAGIDQLGHSLALSGDGGTLAVGAIGVNWGRGAVYIFRKPAGPWASTSNFAAKLTAAAASENDALGTSLAISGDGNTVVGGAMNSSSNFGAAYVFVSPGQWVTANETAALTTYPGGGQYGISIATNRDGSFVLVGQDLSKQTFGFRKPAAGWVSTNLPSSVMLPGGTEAAGRFGHAVALSSDGLLAAIGAFEATVNNVFRAGAVYVTQSAERATQSVTSLNFGSQVVGTVSQPQTVTLTNNAPAGSAPLHITSATQPANFSVTGNCVAASPLAVGASCTEQVAFSPVAAGPVTGNIQFAIDSSAINVSLSGTGANAGSATSITAITPPSANAGQPVTVYFSVTGQGGTATPSGTVTVRASSGESCTGAAPSGSCSLTFATGGVRTLTAAYAGDANYPGSASGGISYTVAAVPAGGFSLYVTPSSIRLPIALPAMAMVSIMPNGGFAGKITLTCAGSSAAASCDVYPREVQVSGSWPGLAMIVARLPRNQTDTFTITATAPGLTRSAQVKVSVQ